MTAYITVGTCPNCGAGVADTKTRTVCPLCSVNLTLKWVVGNLNKAIPCDDRCQYARGPACSCACGGSNHSAGYIDPNMVPQWVRDRDAKQHTAKQARKIANEKKARETKANKVDALIAAHPVLAWLSYIHGGNLDRWLEGRYGATVSMDNFLSDMHWALDKGEMSERQIAAAENSVNRIFNRYAATQKREAEKAATVASGVKAPEGKVTVTGKVVSIKDQVNDFSYYGGVIWKMVVKTDDGWAVWTTIPAKLIDSLSDISGADWRDRILNRTVTFTATLTRSDRDPLFAFGKRPSQASIVE